MQEKFIPFSKVLKEATWPIHQKTDKLVFSQLDANTETLSISFAHWYMNLKKIRFLESHLVRSLVDFDFEYLLSLLPSLQHTTNAPKEAFTDHQRLGMYYVIRGSANGSRFIVKKLKQKHLLKPYFQYLASFDINSWEQFKKRIDQIEEENQQEVIEGATLAFRWLLQEITLSSDLQRNPTDN
ncbi:MAG: hypothetical protein ACO2ZZ_06375 [Cyclobacteriaceae bacterium]